MNSEIARLREALREIADAQCECIGPGDGCSICVSRLASIAEAALAPTTAEISTVPEPPQPDASRP